MKNRSGILLIMLVIMLCTGLSSCEFFSDNPVSPQLKVRTSSMTVEVGASQKCNVSASTRAKLLYASNNESIATVDDKGIVTGVSVGDAVITVVATNQDGSELFLDESAVIAVKVVAKGVKTYESDEVRPLTFEAAMDGVTVTFKFKDGAKPDYKKVEYSFDGYTWTALPSPNYPILLEKAGDIVMFRGDNPTYNGDAQFVIEQAKSNARAMTRSGIHDIHASAIGNLMSMIQKINFPNIPELKGANTFKALLKDAPIDAKSLDGLNKLVMTASQLTEGSLESLLEGTPITVAPVLSITQLVTDCLKNLCKGCTYLEEVNLSFESLAPGSTLVDCMDGMLKDAGTSSDKPLTLTVNLSTGATLDYVDLAVAAGADVVTIISGNDEYTHVIVKDAAGVVHDTYTDEAGNDHDSYIDADGVKHDIIYVKSCAFEQDELTLEVGQEVTLTAVITPNEATDKTVTWKSEDENIATVDKNGKVTAKAVGKIKIRASANGSKNGIDDAVCTVTVVEPTAPSVNDPDDYGDGGDPTAASN